MVWMQCQVNIFPKSFLLMRSSRLVWSFSKTFGFKVFAFWQCHCITMMFCVLCCCLASCHQKQLWMGRQLSDQAHVQPSSPVSHRWIIGQMDRQTDIQTTQLTFSLQTREFFIFHNKFYIGVGEFVHCEEAPKVTQGSLSSLLHGSG